MSRNRATALSARVDRLALMMAGLGRGEKMNSQLLKSVMVLNGDTSAQLAKFLGISEQSLSNKINEKGTEFKQGEITKIKERYGLDCDMVDRIFFAELVS